MSADSIDARQARIAWRCRRGMRELDLLLQRFLDSGLDSLEGADLDRLERLLTQPDQDILAWLWKAAEPEDPELHAIVKVMQSRIQLRAKADE